MRDVIATVVDGAYRGRQFAVHHPAPGGRFHLKEIAGTTKDLHVTEVGGQVWLSEARVRAILADAYVQLDEAAPYALARTTESVTFAVCTADGVIPETLQVRTSFDSPRHRVRIVATALVPAKAL